MRPSGRSSVAALSCLLSLAALSYNTCVVSGLSTKAADGDGDIVGAAEEPIRTDPYATAKASVAVEADGSLMVRQQEVHPHKTSMDLAVEGVGERHHGTFDEDDGDDDDERVVIGAGGLLNGHAVDDRVVRREVLDWDVDLASGADETIRTDPHAAANAIVAGEADGLLMERQHEVHTHNTSMAVAAEGDGERHEGQLVEDRAAGASEHSEAAANIRTRDFRDVVKTSVALLLVGCVIATLIFLLFFSKKDGLERPSDASTPGRNRKMALERNSDDESSADDTLPSSLRKAKE